MRVGATEPEARDAGDGVTGVAGPIACLRVHLQPVRVELDVWIRAGVVERGWNLVVLQRQDHLGQRARTGRGLHVTEVGLRRPQQSGRTDDPATPDHTTECVGLDRIAEDRAGAMGFHVVDGARVDRGVGVGSAQHLHLRLRIRGEQAVGPTVGVDRGTGDHGQHLVAVTTGVGHPLEHHQSATLGTDHAVGVGGERLDVAVLGLRTDSIETERDRGRDDHVDAAGQRDRALARPQAADRLMHGHQGRRAGGVDRDGRPVEVEEVRDAVCDDRRGRTGQRIGRGLLGTLTEAHRRQHLIVVGRRSEEHTHRTALEVAGRDVCVLERLPGEFEREPLLRVHHLDLTRTHLEEVGVEALHIVEVATLDVGRGDDLGDPRVIGELGPPALG